VNVIPELLKFKNTRTRAKSIWSFSTSSLCLFKLPRSASTHRSLSSVSQSALRRIVEEVLHIVSSGVPLGKTSEVWTGRVFGPLTFLKFRTLEFFHNIQQSTAQLRASRDLHLLHPPRPPRPPRPPLLLPLNTDRPEISQSLAGQCEEAVTTMEFIRQDFGFVCQSSLQ
jgi:hypothetical protein